MVDQKHYLYQQYTTPQNIVEVKVYAEVDDKGESRLYDGYIELDPNTLGLSFDPSIGEQYLVEMTIKQR